MKQPGRLNLRWKTMGGKVFWKTLEERGGFRLQQLSWRPHHFRILDSVDIRVWWDTCPLDKALVAFEEVADKGVAPPLNPVEHLSESVVRPAGRVLVDTIEGPLSRLADEAVWRAFSYMAIALLCQATILGLSILHAWIRKRGQVAAGLDPWLVYRAVYLIVMVTTVALAATLWQERIMGATRLVQTKIGLTDQQRNDLYGRIKHIAFRPAATALVTALGVSLCLFLITGEFWT